MFLGPGSVRRGPGHSSWSLSASGKPKTFKEFTDPQGGGGGLEGQEAHSEKGETTTLVSIRGRTWSERDVSVPRRTVKEGSTLFHRGRGPSDSGTDSRVGREVVDRQGYRRIDSLGETGRPSRGGTPDPSYRQELHLLCVKIR